MPNSPACRARNAIRIPDEVEKRHGGRSGGPADAHRVRAALGVAGLGPDKAV